MYSQQNLSREDSLLTISKWSLQILLHYQWRGLDNWLNPNSKEAKFRWEELLPEPNP